MKRILTSLLILFLVCGQSCAQTGAAKTKTQLNTEINTNFPDNNTGLITPSILRQVTLDMVASWQQVSNINSQTGTTYTVVASDYGKIITFNNASPVAVTLPQATTLTPFNFYVLNLGAGLVTITPTTSTIGGVATLSLATSGNSQIVSNAVDWIVLQAIPTNLSALTALASPNTTLDFVPIWDHLTGTVKNVTPSALALAVGAGVISFNSRVGIVLPAAGDYAATQIYNAVNPSGLRITLTTATPVLTTTVSAATTVYCTPYLNQQIPIYDGTRFSMIDTGGELSQTTTDNTKSPTAVGASSVYDLFVWSDAGTIRCTRGPAWTNDTTRSAGTVLVRTKGILLNNASITNGPAASRGTYIGTIRSNGSSQIDYIFGANGTAAFFGVWNYYNRVDVTTVASDNTVSWTYTSNTPRAVNGANLARVTWVSGFAEDGTSASYFEGTNTVAVNGAFQSVGLALDSTSTVDKRGFWSTTAGVVAVGTAGANMSYAPQIGVHFISGIEASDNTNANTFAGGTASGLTVRLRL